MTEAEIRTLTEKQRTYFSSGATLPLETRIRALKKLRSYIREHEAVLNDAIRKDLGKSAYESYMCETGLALTEISYMLRHIRSFARERKECDFVIWKEMLGRIITPEEAVELIENKETKPLAGFTDKEGNAIERKLIINDDFKVKLV